MTDGPGYTFWARKPSNARRKSGNPVDYWCVSYLEIFNKKTQISKNIITSRILICLSSARQYYVYRLFKTVLIRADMPCITCVGHACRPGRPSHGYPSRARTQPRPCHAPRTARGMLAFNGMTPCGQLGRLPRRARPASMPRLARLLPNRPATACPARNLFEHMQHYVTVWYLRALSLETVKFCEMNVVSHHAQSRSWLIRTTTLKTCHHKICSITNCHMWYVCIDVKESFAPASEFSRPWWRALSQLIWCRSTYRRRRRGKVLRHTIQ